MKTPTRILTIEDFNPTGRWRRTSSASLIRLKGCWLKEAGFNAGAQVIINNPSPGVMELRVNSPVPLDASYFQAMHQLDTTLK